MSRIAKKTILLNDFTTVKEDNFEYLVSGKLGTVSVPILNQIDLVLEDNKCYIRYNNKNKNSSAKAGLLRSLISNAVIGVNSGFQTVLVLKGLGYKVFLDLKLHDIPNTVAKSITNIAKLGADITNIHASGG